MVLLAPPAGVFSRIFYRGPAIVTPATIAPSMVKRSALSTIVVGLLLIAAGINYATYPRLAIVGAVLTLAWVLFRRH